MGLRKQVVRILLECFLVIDMVGVIILRVDDETFVIRISFSFS